MAGRQSVMADAATVALKKQELGMRRKVVPIGPSRAEIVAKTPTRFKKADVGGTQIQIRRVGRGGPRITSRRAASLKACKGKRGCDFANCVEQALGVMPKGLQVTCGLRRGAAATRTPGMSEFTGRVSTDNIDPKTSSHRDQLDKVY